MGSGAPACLADNLPAEAGESQNGSSCSRATRLAPLGPRTYASTMSRAERLFAGAVLCFATSLALMACSDDEAPADANDDGGDLLERSEQDLALLESCGLEASCGQAVDSGAPPGPETDCILGALESGAAGRASVRGVADGSPGECGPSIELFFAQDRSVLVWQRIDGDCSSATDLTQYTLERCTLKGPAFFTECRAAIADGTFDAKDGCATWLEWYSGCSAAEATCPS